MKQIAHTINREGKVIPGNGFKQPTPTATPNNYGIWGHSIERTDAANPIQGFVVLGITLAVFGLIIKYFVV